MRSLGWLDLKVTRIHVAELVNSVFVQEEETILSTNSKLNAINNNNKKKSCIKHERVSTYFFGGVGGRHLQEQRDIALVLFSLPAWIQTQLPADVRHGIVLEGSASHADSGSREFESCFDIVDLKSKIKLERTTYSPFLAEIDWLPNSVTFMRSALDTCIQRSTGGGARHVASIPVMVLVIDISH